MKAGAIGCFGAGYLAVGVGVASWSAARGQAGKPHWSGLGSNAGVALASTVVLWPVAVVQNLRAKPAAA